MTALGPRKHRSGSLGDNLRRLPFSARCNTSASNRNKSNSNNNSSSNSSNNNTSSILTTTTTISSSDTSASTREPEEHWQQPSRKLKARLLVYPRNIRITGQSCIMAGTESGAGWKLRSLWCQQQRRQPHDSPVQVISYVAVSSVPWQCQPGLNLSIYGNTGVLPRGTRRLAGTSTTITTTTTITTSMRTRTRMTIITTTTTTTTTNNDNNNNNNNNC
ncbi:hypothetical protein HZH66_000198 [Vespula vulgaris]|uniref:Uncharacterized protein n=1 Tax=Vespula vulgaris TaxID=7454 RepID=A0A834NJ39_VESVU|nr:hypothetical protein HZH66_000198 [Vespula vulgaris]